MGIPMGIPWEWEVQTEFIGMGMGMVDGKWEGNGNSSLEEIPVSRVNHIFGIILSPGSLNNLLFLYSNLA